MRNKKKYIVLGVLGLILATTGIVWAAFTDKGNVLGSTFSVSSADIKIMEDVTLGTAPDNLVDEIPGPSFENISEIWEQDYVIKLVNTGTTLLDVISRADYETVNDPEDLRQDIYVEIFEWNDTDWDGVLDEGEKNTSYGKKTIVKWKTEGIAVGEFNEGQSKPLVLTFSTDGISETKQGATALFDFVFESMERE